MAKKVLNEDEKRELTHLLSSNQMFLKSIDEAKMRGKNDAVKRLELARQDVIAQIAKISPSEAKKADSERLDDGLSLTDVKQVDLGDTLSVHEVLERYNQELAEMNDVEVEASSEDTYSSHEEEVLEDDTFVAIEETSTFVGYNNIDPNVQYDIISLPSRGQCYKHKIDRLPVGYLTAFDENLITSPNLYKDGLIIDFLLKHKVLDKNINLDELCSGDVDAIILFLRATSYGPEFPITARDPQSGEEIESVVDLTTLKMKDFNLIGDENGHFEYELPVSKDKVKFKFLTRKDERALQMLSKLENDGIKAQTMKESLKVLGEAIKSESSLDGKTKQEYLNYLTKIRDLATNLEKKRSTPYSRIITNRLEMSIVSVNGDNNPNNIAKYVRNMGAKDSLMLRRYILENEPGINFEIEIERPVSLGGGSFKTFLEWDDAVFLNIA